jgi:hypothetical protein
MKTKTYITALLCLISNVATAGSVSVGYTSDYFRRGAVLSSESVQSSLSLDSDVAGLSASAGVSTNLPTAGGSDSYLMEAGASKQLSELLNVYIGLEHFEELAGDSNLDARVSLELSSFLSPTLTVYRNTSDDLYTFELSAKHGVDNDIADLCFHALYGNTDITSSINEDYYGLGVIASKSVSENSTLGLSYDYFDSDLISNGESVLGLSLSVNF